MNTNEFDKIKPDGGDTSGGLDQTIDDILNEIANKKNGTGETPLPPAGSSGEFAPPAEEPQGEPPIDDSSGEERFEIDSGFGEPEPPEAGEGYEGGDLFSADDSDPADSHEPEVEPEPELTGEQVVDDFFDKLQSAAGKPDGGDKKGKKKLASEDKPARKKGMSKAAKRVWGNVLKVVLGLFCAVVIIGCVAAVGLSIYLMNETQDDDELLDLTTIKLSYATIFYAENPDYDPESEEEGAQQQWVEYERIYGEENRQWIDYADMPQHLIDALVASEDQRFWTHSGVDWKRTIVAFLNYMPGVDIGSGGGGSTIDQQLIKNITDEKESTGIDGALRKVREIYRALSIEKRFSKEQILEAYLNTFRLSGTVAGIESAANTYFNKTTQELTVAECAAILCITKAPTAYNPLTNPEENKAQRDYILWAMHDQGYLSDSEYEAAQRESDTMVFGEYETESASGSGVYSYFTDTVIDEVLDDLVELGNMTSSEAYDMLFNQGLKVYLTIDLNVQQSMEELLVNSVMESNYDSDHVWPNEDMLSNEVEGSDGEVIRTETVQGAAVVMDMKGELKGIIGGIYDKEESRGLNRAYDSTRSPGSSIKPVAVYAEAIETDKITFSTLFPDTSSRTINGQQWPRNWSNTYGDPVTVYSAVQQSLNTVAVHTIDLLGEEFCYDFMTTRFGYTTLVSAEDNPTTNDIGPSLALGGLTNGVTVYEMAAAYVTFGNGGTYYEPHSYSLVTYANGDTIIDKTSSIREVQALSEDTAYIMNKLLQGVLQSGGTGTNARFSTNLPIAGKSGTTSDNYDYWFVGLTPYYVCAVWQGFDTPGYMYTWRPHPTQKAFKAVMGAIHEDLEYKNFPTAEGVISASFCKQSGDIAGPACTETLTGYYKEDNVPNECVHIFVPTVEP